MQHDQRVIKAKKLEKYLNQLANYTQLKDPSTGHSIDLMTFPKQLSNDLDSYFSLGFTNNHFQGEIVSVQAHGLGDSFVSELLTKLYQLSLPLEPGLVIEDILDPPPAGKLKHIILMSPFLWPEKLSEETDYLLVVPLTEEEVQFGKKWGIHRLQELMSIYDVDISDLNRDSINIPAF